MTRDLKVPWRKEKKLVTFNFAKMEILRLTTAGSIDDGKSTLIGRLLYDTRSLKKDQVKLIEDKSESLGYEYLDLSLATDGLLTEREQGITIDVSHLYFNTSGRRFIIADAPGHEEYTRNMVTGASNVKLAIILLDARKGVMKQTKRHLFITQLLKIENLIFAINKMDLIDYKKIKFENIKSEILKLMEDYNWNPKLNFIPVSALLGDNIISKSEKMMWYKGQALLPILENLKIVIDKGLDSFVQIQNVIRSKTKEMHEYRGFTGKVKSGFFSLGDEIEVFPSKIKTKIKSIEKFGQIKTMVYEGENATIILEDEIDVSRGNTFVKLNNNLKTGINIKAMVCWLQSDSLKQSSKYWLQHGVHKIQVRIDRIEFKMDWNSWGKINSSSLDINDIGEIDLKLAEPIIYSPFAVNRNIGVFILIDPRTNNTAGVGFIK